MKKIILFVLLLIMISHIAAETKSIRKAMLFSAILPGMGEMYSKNYNRAATFLAVEAATWFAYFRLKSERQWALNSYKDFASSITETPKDSPDWYYQLLQDYPDSETYNADIIRDARNYYLIYQNDPVAYEEYLEQYLVPEESAWDWENNRNWYKFRDLRRDKQNMEIYMKFAFAAAIVNRFISVVDSAILTRRFNKEQKNIGSLQVYPDLANMGLKLKYEIKF
ncbi:MAG: hypothetical protein K9N09_00880 [Candidatus Cloacimonetes bacterium]|nr:hypothetical protein [Candidatus Cloacimonadota bacterium]MCF7813030.1 hypothetical protein [Candidatus Cloacimonadota bacterium]MCF7867229.1 hypothetical protein [Candidatus Cloacimonadota bacterium]MCF7882673.1 hypothetical protein [Candidatus Cloacimonadota bacterium]